MAQLVEKLLQISRFETGNVQLAREPIGLASLAHKAVERASKSLASHHFVLDNAMELPQTMGDPDRIREVMDNLLENAVHYSPEGTTVTLGTGLKNGSIVVWVKDQGIGIPKEAQNRIFQKFFRADNAIGHTSRGSGLGLNVCKYTVEAHGGQIWFDSEEGKGTIFYFRLPVVRA